MNEWMAEVDLRGEEALAAWDEKLTKTLASSLERLRDGLQTDAQALASLLEAGTAPSADGSAVRPTGEREIAAVQALHARLRARLTEAALHHPAAHGEIRDALAGLETPEFLKGLVLKTPDASDPAAASDPRIDDALRTALERLTLALEALSKTPGRSGSGGASPQGAGSRATFEQLAARLERAVAALRETDRPLEEAHHLANQAQYERLQKLAAQQRTEAADLVRDLSAEDSLTSAEAAPQSSTIQAARDLEQAWARVEAVPADDSQALREAMSQLQVQRHRLGEALARDQARTVTARVDSRSDDEESASPLREEIRQRARQLWVEITQAPLARLKEEASERMGDAVVWGQGRVDGAAAAESISKEAVDEMIREARTSNVPGGGSESASGITLERTQAWLGEPDRAKLIQLEKRVETVGQRLDQARHALDGFSSSSPQEAASAIKQAERRFQSAMEKVNRLLDELEPTGLAPSEAEQLAKVSLGWRLSPPDLASAPQRLEAGATLIQLQEAVEQVGRQATIRRIELAQDALGQAGKDLAADSGQIPDARGLRESARLVKREVEQLQAAAEKALASSDPQSQAWRRTLDELLTMANEVEKSPAREEAPRRE